MSQKNAIATFIPDRFIDSATYREDLAGHTFEFAVQFTVFGEVLDVKCTFLDLPPVAQQLMLGDRYQRISEKVRGVVDRFRFLVPLVGYGTVGGDAWGEISEKLGAMKKLDGYRKLSYRKHIADEWVRLSWLEYKNRTDKLLLLRTLYFGRNEVRLRTVEKIYPRHATLLEPVLYNLLLLEDYAIYRRLIFTVLGKLGSETARQFLLKQLTDEQDIDKQKGALAGLAYSRNEAVGQALVDYYHAQPNLDSERLEYLLIGLRFYTNPAVRQICLREAVGKFHGNSERLFKRLQQNGVGEQELHEKLSRVLRDRPSVDQVVMALKLYTKFKRNDLLPDGDMLLGTLVWSEKINNRHQIRLLLAGLFDRRSVRAAVLDRLTSQVTDPNAYTRYLTAVQLGYAGRASHFKVLFPLIQDPDTGVSNQAFLSLENLMRKYPKQDHVFRLIRELRNEIVPPRQEKLVRILTPVLARHRGSVDTNLFLDLLKSEIPSVRSEAVRALGEIATPRALEGVRRGLRDSHAMVQHTARQAIHRKEKATKSAEGADTWELYRIFGIILFVVVLLFRNC
ncbi:HEAT repeat domain-containing protein [Flavilitoribacter nigricans]|nr:HEAT repeat domain-containing protein [Flavilitoribacter nigricans]